MKSWNHFINEEYRYVVPPEYLEKITTFINEILKENGLSWDEYLEIEEYANSLMSDDLGDGGLNLRISRVSTNAFITSSDFKASDLARAKNFIKKEMTRNIKWSKERSESAEEIKEFHVIIDELTDLYKLYPKDKESLESYAYDETILMLITPKNMEDLLEISKIYHYIGYAISRQTFFRVLQHRRESDYVDSEDYNKLRFILGSNRKYPIEKPKSRRQKSKKI